LKGDKKLLENLIGQINLELYIILLKVYNGDMDIDKVISGFTKESVTEESVTEESVTEESVTEEIDVIQNLVENEEAIESFISNDQNGEIDKINYIDLCHGMGGFRYALDNYKGDVNFNCVYSADIKKSAISTYNLNFNENESKKDINDITNLPPFNLLCAGFPCQPFSSAGNKKGMTDKRGQLIFKIIDICQKYKPEHIILENVSNILKINGGKCMSIIIEEFNKIGYHISYKLLNARKFGIPQDRKRLFIVGCLSKKIDLEKIKYKPENNLDIVIDNSLKYNDFDDSLIKKLTSLDNKLHGVKLQDYRAGPNNIHTWELELKGSLTEKEKEIMNIIVKERRKKTWEKMMGLKNTDGIPLTYDIINKFYLEPDLKSVLDNLVKLKYLHYVKINEEHHGYTIKTGKLSIPFNRILDPNGYAPTLTATDCCKLVVLIDNKYLRRLSTKELNRVCGFPDNFKIPDGVNKYDLYGNMVIPTIVDSVLDVMF
jgi:DNA (cytosine-5)-methyltransferase 1